MYKMFLGGLRSMNICIQEVNDKNSSDINKFTSSFIVDSILKIKCENNSFSYTVEKVPSYEKIYFDDDEEFTNPKDYINSKNKIIYLAYKNGQVVGQIVLRKNWNNYAFIEDVRVDANCRGEGLGIRLVECAKEWAKARNLAGISLETQNINVRACKFYESCGFMIGGIDNSVYKGIDSENHEIAMYWYYRF